MQFGPESLLPPVVAILLAIATRRVILPLAIGVLIGAALLASQEPATAWTQTPVIFAHSLYASVADKAHQQVVWFTLLMGAMVGVMELGGAMRSLIAVLSHRIHSRRGAQTMIATSGLVIFFDDYANSLLVGGTMRSTADRFAISREKLAYLVDSTAAPVAGLSLISTWAVTEINYIADGLTKAGIDDPAAALTMFIQSIPYRFYPWFALGTVFAVAWTGRDLGAMHRAESETVSNPQAGPKSHNLNEPPWLWTAAVIPIVACVVAVVVTLIVTGRSAIAESAADSSGGLLFAIEVLGNGDAYLALIVGSAIGLLLTVVGHRVVGSRSLSDQFRYAAQGAWQMMPAILILWFAWALSAMTDDGQLNTGSYLANVLTDRISPETLPTIVFLIAGAVAFSTGTSWGTMAILTPLAIDLAFRLVGDPDPSGPIVLATCGSVLAGAIFGDHCSPISDTTVLSSRASGCDHVAHVRTQMPYALIAGGVSMLLGTLPASWGVSPWFSLPAGLVCLALIIRWFGRPVKQSS
jgi:Na+/H+ antiporter NhaC